MEAKNEESKHTRCLNIHQCIQQIVLITCYVMPLAAMEKASQPQLYVQWWCYVEQIINSVARLGVPVCPVLFATS
jgi:hypothetical protein